MDPPTTANRCRPSGGSIWNVLLPLRRQLQRSVPVPCCLSVSCCIDLSTVLVIFDTLAVRFDYTNCTYDTVQDVKQRVSRVGVKKK